MLGDSFWRWFVVAGTSIKIGVETFVRDRRGLIPDGAVDAWPALLLAPLFGAFLVALGCGVLMPYRGSSTRSAGGAPSGFEVLARFIAQNVVAAWSMAAAALVWWLAVISVCVCAVRLHKQHQRIVHSR